MLYFWTSADSVEARNLRTDARAVVCIATHEEPYQYVIAEGTCVISDAEVPARCCSISKRYYGEARGTEVARKDLEAGCGCLRPETGPRYYRNLRLRGSTGMSGRY